MWRPKSTFSRSSLWMLRITQFLVIFRNHAGWLACRHLGAGLETGWLARRGWFLTSECVLYVRDIASSSNSPISTISGIGTPARYSLVANVARIDLLDSFSIRSVGISSAPPRRLILRISVRIRCVTPAVQRRSPTRARRTLCLPPQSTHQRTAASSTSAVHLERHRGVVHQPRRFLVAALTTSTILGALSMLLPLSVFTSVAPAGSLSILQ